MTLGLVGSRVFSRRVGRNDSFNHAGNASAAAMVAFHLANAAMLPLVGQVPALRNADVGSALMAMCIAAAQVVMVPAAYLAGAKADTWGRKPIFLIAFAVLMARGFLYTLSDNSTWLVSVQLLAGAGLALY